MASTVASLKAGAFVIAVCVVLLQSSMGQQPPATTVSSFDYCYNQCTSNCSNRCQALADSEVRKCNITLDVYASCFKSCNTRCFGNYYAYASGSCSIGSCLGTRCGSLCGCSCCDRCTRAAREAASRCMAGAGRAQYCMPDCPNYCNNTCVKVSAPPPPTP